jgi:hypothetical protein
MRPKRASSKARTFSGLSGSGRLSSLTLPANFFESLLLLGVGLLVTLPARLELYLAAPEKLSYAVGVRVLYAAFAQEPMSLRDGGYLSLLHGLLEFFEGFGRDQLLATALVYSASLCAYLWPHSPLVGYPSSP